MSFFQLRSRRIQNVLANPPGAGGSTGDVKVYLSGSFQPKPVKVWTGSAWVVKPVKVWNGSAWVITNY